MGDLCGLRMGMILAIFQMLGMVLCWMEWLYMSVSVRMAWGPRCLRCVLDMLSGPVELEFFMFRMVPTTIAGVNCGGRGSVCSL